MFAEKPIKPSEYIDDKSEINLNHAEAPPTPPSSPTILKAKAGSFIAQTKQSVSTTISSDIESVTDDALTLLENINQKSIINGLDENNDNILLNVEQQERFDSIDQQQQHIIMSDVGVVGDLSCLKNGFHPAPDVRNADIKYMRYK